MQQERQSGRCQAREVVFLYAAGQDRILGMGVGSSSIEIEDSRSLWDQIWTNRDAITEIAHTHPVGPGRLSGTDIETARAVVQALGKPVLFTVVHPNGYASQMFFPDGTEGDTVHRDGPLRWWWMNLMWELSWAFEPKAET